MDRHSLSIVRVLGRPVEEVYRAWTEPARLAAWVGRVDEADVRIGGRYRFVNDDGEGGEFVHVGEYVDLVPDRTIVMTFRAEQVEDNPYENETITIDLRPLENGRTELTLTNRWEGAAMEPDDLEAVEEGWNAWLDLLDEALA